jgi:hypothetical protein
MKVLVHGTPFFCDMGIMDRYEGSHDLRSLGPDEGCDYTYAPLEETASDAITRIGGEWRPDMLLCWQPEAHPPPRGIEDVPIRTVALVSDWNVYYPVLETNLARYDVVLTDKPGVEIFKGHGLTDGMVTPQHIRPLYSQITPAHYPHDVEKDIDVLFIGNLNHAAHRERAVFLERLAKLSDQYRIVITTGIQGDAYGRLMSRARIVFNHSIRGEMNLRVFETMACGAMAMLEDSNREVRDWFTDGEEIVLYNADNFEEVIQRFLNDPSRAQKIAAAGHEQIASMSGERTFDDIIDRAAALPCSDRKFLSLSERDRVLQTALMYGRLPHDRWRPYAAGLFGHLLDTASHDAEVHAAYIHFLLGATEKEWPRIQEHAQRAAELDPDSIPYAWNVLQVEEWLTSTKPDDSKLLPLLEKNGTQGSGLLLGTQADPFWTRCYRSMTEAGGIAPEVFHHEIVLRTISVTGALKEGLQQLDRVGQSIDPESLGTRLLAELMWNNGQKNEAAILLRSRLTDHFPLDMAIREKVLGWFRELGRMDEWKELSTETLQILKAFPESV